MVIWRVFGLEEMIVSIIPSTEIWSTPAFWVFEKGALMSVSWECHTAAQSKATPGSATYIQWQYICIHGMTQNDRSIQDFYIVSSATHLQTTCQQNLLLTICMPPEHTECKYYCSCTRRCGGVMKEVTRSAYCSHAKNQQEEATLSSTSTSNLARTAR